MNHVLEEFEAASLTKTSIGWGLETSKLDAKALKGSLPDKTLFVKLHHEGRAVT